MNSNAEPLTAKPRTLKELSVAYGIDPRTFKNWLKFYYLQKDISFCQPEFGYYYSIKQIEEIIAVMGNPI